MGTPSEATWTRVSEYPGWKNDFPHYPIVPWSSILVTMDATALDLLSGLLQYIPNNRLGAADALKHPFFQHQQQHQQQQQ
jgi:serine/threonine protein kinase